MAADTRTTTAHQFYSPNGDSDCAVCHEPADHINHQHEDVPTPPRETRETRETKPPWWSESVTGTVLDAMVFPPLAYLVAPFIPIGGLVMLSGPPKSFKSLLALSCGLAVAGGGIAMGKVQAQQGRVVYIALDDQSLARSQRRIRDHLEPGTPIPPLFILHTKPNLGQGAAAAKALDRYLTAHPDCCFIIIDTLEHLRADRTPGESLYRGDVKALANLRWVLDRHPHATILALHHNRKGDDDDAVTSVGGTHGVTGGVDALLGLSGRRGSPRRMLDVITRDDDDFKRVVQVTRQGLMLTDDDPDDPAVLLSPDDQRLYRTLANFPDGATAGEVGQAHPGIQNIGNRLLRLAKDGYLVKRARGLYVVN